MKKSKTRAGKRFSGRKTVIIILSVVLAFNMILLAGRIAEESTDYSYEASSLYSSLRSGDYVDVKEMAVSNESRGLSEKAGTEDFNTFVKYYEAKELYEAYSAAGDSGKAEEQRVIMQSAYDALPRDIINELD